jgi:ABC-type phosphate transport system substrate-binding protein
MAKRVFQLFSPLLLILAGLMQQQTAAQADNPDDIVVIANRNLPVSALSLTEVKRIFRKEVTVYQGNRLQPIHAKSGSALRVQFVSRVLGMNDSGEQKYWQDMRVKKGMRPPIELSNTVRAVFSAPGAISYCFRKDFNPTTAKMLLTI